MIEPDDDCDNNSIQKRLLYQTLCWMIWFASNPRRYFHAWEMISRDINRPNYWKDYP
jgi:hypothetical protein